MGLFGKLVLRNPFQLARTPDGFLLVPDRETRSVHVFDSQGRTVRTLGAGHLQMPSCVACWEDEVFC
jgi:hypothetical protein